MVAYEAPENLGLRTQWWFAPRTHMPLHDQATDLNLPLRGTRLWPPAAV